MPQCHLGSIFIDFIKDEGKIIFEILDKKSALDFREYIKFNTFYSGITLDFSKSGMSNEEIDKSLEYLSKYELDDDMSNVDVIK